MGWLAPIAKAAVAGAAKAKTGALAAGKAVGGLASKGLGKMLGTKATTAPAEMGVLGLGSKTPQAVQALQATQAVQPGLMGMLGQRYGLSQGMPSTGKEWMNTLQGLSQMKSDIQGITGGGQEMPAPEAQVTPGVPMQFASSGFGLETPPEEGGYLDLLGQLGIPREEEESLENYYSVPGYW